ncbi:MAG: AgmX/PglI C-terminal domain-containing protein [Pseudomonadota bacterium]
MSTTTLTVSFRHPVLPWAGSLEDDVRFARVRRAVLVVSTVLCLVVLLKPVVVPDRSQAPDLPPRLATMILENAKPPPVIPTAKLVSKPEQPHAVSRNPEPPRKVALNKEAPVPEARVPVPNKAPGEADAARRKAAGVGLLAMSKDLAELHGAPLAVQLAPVKQGPGVGTGTGVGVGAGTAPGLPTRALITSNASSGSGGINTAAFSNNAGGGGLAGRATTLVEGAVGGGGGGGPGGGGARGKGDGTGSGLGSAGSVGGKLAQGGSGKASRSIEEIKLVFERNKGAIYSIYNRALRDEPGLQGKVVLELKIAPAGHVVECRIVSSELKTPELEAKLLARVRQFDFSAKDVDQMVVTWPVDFLPS